MSEADAEIAALAVVAESLEPLTLPARQRVLDWAHARFIGGKEGEIMVGA